MPEDSDGVPAPERVERIEFQNVSFSYRTGGPVLKRVSFTIQAGVTCAIAGYNGAGKTTLIKLLLRLYDPTEGRILVNGRDIREYNLRSYRRLFAIAFQDGKILARSVRDNVSMGEKISEERIWQALKLAGTDKTIEALTCGLDTVLTKEFTEDGAVLSGGQAQKIIAARAFVQDSPVMVFDEPSSALDPIAEYELFQSISRAKQDKLLVFISHRLSSVQNASWRRASDGGGKPSGADAQKRGICRPVPYAGQKLPGGLGRRGLGWGEYFYRASQWRKGGGRRWKIKKLP